MRRLIVSFDLKLPGLRRDKAEHHGLALGQKAERLEAAGALGVILHEIAVHLDGVEQDVGDRLVAAARDDSSSENSRGTDAS